MNNLFLLGIGDWGLGLGERHDDGALNTGVQMTVRIGERNLAGQSEPRQARGLL